MKNEANEQNHSKMTDSSRLKAAHSLLKCEFAEEALSMLQLVEDESYRNCEEYLRLELSCLVYLKRFSEVEMLARTLIDKFDHIFQAPWLALISALQSFGREEEADAVFWETFRYWPNDPRLVMAANGLVQDEN